MTTNKITQRDHNPPGNYHKSRAPQSDTHEKDGKGCTCSMDNKIYDHCGDPCNNPGTPEHHAELAPLTLPPPEPPKPTSSHASSESSEVGASTSCNEPPCDSTDGTFDSTIALSSSQKETKESLEEQDLRGGGLACPDKTKEWRSWKEAGMGDCPKLPTIEH
jgi:hypothetical protein